MRAAGGRVVVVEDDADLAMAIADAVCNLDPSPVVAGTVAEALAHLEDAPSLVICDVRLPDGSGLEVAEAACRLRPIPPIIAISGSATAEEGFALARQGVRAYLQKPLRLAELRQAIECAMTRPAPLEPLVASLVGQRTLDEVQAKVRRALVEQALALAGGNRTEASRLLRVTRQAVQQMARQFDLYKGTGRSGR